MPGPKPLDIFIVAEQFRATAYLAHRIPVIARNVPELHQVNTLHLPTSVMVCSALALELYFKCLIRLGRKSFSRAHDLVGLFALIAPKQQARIRRCWKQSYLEIVRSDLTRFYALSGRPMPKANFNTALSISKDAFTQIRYVYEGVESDTGWVADGILDCARKRILEMHPNWEHMRQIYPQDSIEFHFPHT